MPLDLKKLYTPKEAAILYNSNKIRFNPTSYTLKEHLILNRSIGELAPETISTYDYRAEQKLFDILHDQWSASALPMSKMPTKDYGSTLLPTEADCAAVKEYNLSIGLDYLTSYGRILPTDIKNSALMNAIVRMCIALDSVESCCKEMYWFITNLWDRPYVELHNFEPLKKAFEATPIELPMCFAHNGIDIIQNNVAAAPTVLEESFHAASYYKAYYYALEFLWAYYRLNDPELKRAIAWWVEHCGGETILKNLYEAYNSELVVPSNIEQMVCIADPAKRFEAYQEFVKANDSNVMVWANNLAPDNMYVPMNPVSAMFIAYAESVAVTHVRVNSLALLYTYCADNGLIEPSDADSLDEMFEGATGIGSMFQSGMESSDEKSLMDLEKSKPSGVGGETESGSKYKGNNGIFEALDKLNSTFQDGRYSYEVKDIRVTDENIKPTYEKICDKVSLLNRNLIQKIKDIKTYNTGGKNPGVATGRLDRKAIHRYRYDPNIFYNNTYKQLESDLAFGIILDESGSMCGKGISDGKVTMIVLHETLKALGINHSIIGHTSRRGDYTCDIERYQSFKEDKTYTVCKNYALANISAHACNCDSGALYYMERAMDRVQNKDKIVLIFSDGYPTACSSSDLINQVSNMEKKGIKVIGIGIDFPSISKYYTDYANGRNLQDMLNIVTSILQEYILKKKVD